MSARLTAFMLTCMLIATASAHTFVTGQPVPPVGVAVNGELTYQQEEFSYQPWNSAHLPGKVRVILHLAGRMAAKEQNEPLTQALAALRLPADRYQTTLIVNTDDAIPGSAVFVRASLKSSKKESPWSQFIIDGQGSARQAWQLKAEGSAVIVLDKEGKVRFARDGALSPAEVHQVVTLLKSLLT
ncbi:YtfJ family protein [Erwinia sp. P6884]|uniref:YtfJ family protein n=1 Tax=Erwinia sp. P6884 TaxID=3141450 RepID=UPI003193FA64